MHSLLVCALLFLSPIQERQVSRAPRPYQAQWIKAPDETSVFAGLYKGSDDPRTPMLVMLHEARSSRGEYTTIAKRLMDAGYNCLAVDLRSGKSSKRVQNLTAKFVFKAGGRPTTLDTVQDIEAALQWVRDEGHAAGKLVLWGSSFSASLALHLVSKKPTLADVVVAFSPGEYFTGLGMPEDWILRSVGEVRCPTFLTSSPSEAEVVRGYFDALPAEGKALFLPTGPGGHGSSALWDEQAGHEEYWRALEAFLKTHAPLATKAATTPDAGPPEEDGQ